MFNPPQALVQASIRRRLLAHPIDVEALETQLLPPRKRDHPHNDFPRHLSHQLGGHEPRLLVSCTGQVHTHHIVRNPDWVLGRTMKKRPVEPEKIFVNDMSL